MPRRSPARHIPIVVLLAACSSPPKPPWPDESRRRPANAALAVDLQHCQASLRNQSIALSDARRAVAVAQAAHVPEPPQPAINVQPEPPASNGLYVVWFGHGSSHLDVPEDTAAALREEALTAPWIELRGRTDGLVDTSAEHRIARARAAAARDWLIRAGVDADRIRTTHQATGDHLADNGTEAGRRLNRRVEIEIYRAAPVPLNAPAARATPVANALDPGAAARH